MTSQASIKFISRQKWDANLSAEDSLVALDIMERLGFEKRTEFIRHALTNPVLLEQEAGFISLRERVASSDLDAQIVTRIEDQLREIYALLQQGITRCPDPS